jgi:hypothetical protein
MQEETLSILRSMENWSWFERAGEPIDYPGVIALGSWGEAIEPDRSYNWECLRLQVHNVSCQTVNLQDWNRAQQRSPIVNEVKQALRPLLDRIRTIGSRLSLPEKNFYHQVAWDLIGICMETEYADIYPPPFSIPVLAPWYRDGHFPCGWDGPVLDTDWNGEFPHYNMYVY